VPQPTAPPGYKYTSKQIIFSYVFMPVPGGDLIRQFSTTVAGTLKTQTNKGHSNK
jgi:hypothetical protein